MKKIYTLLLVLVGLSAVAQTGMIKEKVTTIYDKYTHENYSINPIAPRNMVATIAYRIYSPGMVQIFIDLQA